MSTIKTLNVKVNGLHSNKKYRFDFANKGGNWPVRVSPLSGVFYPSGIKTYVYFCSTTGECPANDPSVFFNTPATDPAIPGLALDNKSLYSVLELSIKEFDCDEIIYTYPCIVECDECIPKLSITTSAISLGYSDGTETTFSSSVEGLVPNQTYKYTFSGVGGNWPVQIIPRSGIIQTSDTSYTINGLASICQTTGVCSSGNSNVLNYTTIPNNSDLLYSMVELSVEPVDIMNSNFQMSAASAFAIQCEDCMRRLSVSAVTPIEATTSPNSVTATLINTIPGRTYSYSIQPIDVNWPVLIYPYSGTLIATSDTADLLLGLTFCSSTGLCPSGTDGLLPYVLNKGTKHARFKLKIEDSCADSVSLCSNNWGPASTTYSNEIIANYIDNSPPLVVTNSDTEATLTPNDNNIFTLQSMVNNLIPGESYKYNINVIDNNWPVIISRQSGEFTAVSSSKLLKTNLSFCNPSGSCLTNNDAILTYENNHADTKFITVNLSVDSVNDYIGAYSDDFTLLCEGCLSMNPLNVNFSGYPMLSLSECACSGTQLALVNITGALPNHSYDYIFTSSSNKLTLSPSSGSAAFGSSGSGTIMSVMNLSFSSGDKSVVQMKLRDPINNIEASNQLAIQCLGSDQSCKNINPLYVQFADSPRLDLTECACSGNRLVSINVTGTMPSVSYNYTLTSTSNKISFNPSSGTMLFGSSGSGSIMSIFNLSMVSGDKSIVQIKLHDNANNIEAIDYLPVRCSGSCDS